MRKSEIDDLLTTMLESHDNVSDLNVTVDRPLQVESAGELVGVPVDPAIDSLTPFQTEIIALNLMNNDRRLSEHLLRQGSCDSSYSLPGKARFRVNIFSQRGAFSIVLRKLETNIPSIEELKLPELKPKRAATLDEPDYVREGWDKRGARSRLDRRRTMKEAMKRHAVQEDAVHIVNDDLRFRQLVKRALNKNDLKAIDRAIDTARRYGHTLLTNENYQWGVVGRYTVHQAYPNNSREDGIAGAFDRDIADVSLAKHASSAECRGETLSLDRFWNRLHHRALLNLAKLTLFRLSEQLTVDHVRSP